MFVANGKTLSNALKKFIAAQHKYFMSTELDDAFNSTTSEPLRRPTLLRSTLWEFLCSVSNEDSKVVDDSSLVSSHPPAKGSTSA